MTAKDMGTWADKLRAKYGILWPISLVSDDENDLDDNLEMEKELA